jgi:hypothetical protein
MVNAALPRVRFCSIGLDKDGLNPSAVLSSLSLIVSWARNGFYKLTSADNIARIVPLEWCFSTIQEGGIHEKD